MSTMQTPSRKYERAFDHTVEVLGDRVLKAEGEVAKCLKVAIATGDADAIH